MSTPRVVPLIATKSNNFSLIVRSDDHTEQMWLVANYLVCLLIHQKQYQMQGNFSSYYAL